MISGICSICGSPGRVYSCHLCGKQTCQEHFNQGKGVCVSCGSGRLIK
ncbi:MAG: hypothetical protein V3R86_05415 [Candidatus Hydrothermarchaeaceae archaeon]